LIDFDRKVVTVVASSLVSLGFFLAAAVAGSAAAAPTPAGPNAAGTAVASTPQTPPETAGTEPSVPAGSGLSVFLSENGTLLKVSTQTQTVGDLLLEHDIHVGPNDYLSSPLDTPLSNGMKVLYRRAVVVHLRVGNVVHTLQTTELSVGDLLGAQRITLARTDVVTPSLNDALEDGCVVAVERVDEWTSRVVDPIAPAVEYRNNPQLEAGNKRVAFAGAAGLRLTTFRYVRRNGGTPSRMLLASRIVRAPRPRVIEQGIATYESFASVAEQGFRSAMHMAGSALHMIATAYTAGCAGCSGITATGLRAGFGIIAVDPRVIPLGTRLFVPGYGRAVAGDTGGAIRGNLIDLGMNSYDDAIRWGRRPVVVYVLR